MSDFQRIDPIQASELLQGGAQLADIRDPQSYQLGHIPGAVRLDNDNLAQFVATADKQTPLLVCCYHGNSSQPAAAYLASLGFAAVYSLDGGFELWRQQFPEQISHD
ncbi:thiosulfate sulfurtransferase GlpE [Halopseudomonas sabulinigri]|uniref:Thiosulfate sulfurtransferase GlpE n=1 Tax=Halopseudomonas sabulinigri TaxID=472181 RepID=A0A1H1SAN9_9GAMM|nr:thiosulfate sulfurtransferase GlpE [Halopseudomonas sabulinigri]SDS44943.1 thiosulfate sulfurtransferase [Halopseudomonas sabulinigri]